MKYEEEEKEQEEKQKPTKDDVITLNKHIKETNINEEVFKKDFNFQKPSDTLMLLNTIKDKTKNNDLVNIINSGLKDLKEDIKDV